MPKNILRPPLLYRGRKFSIYYIQRADGAVPSKNFLDDLAKERPGRVAQMLALAKRLATVGKIYNNRKFRSEGHGIWALKIPQVRLYCYFRANRIIIVTHGFIKKATKGRKLGREVKRAQRLREAFERLIESNLVRFE